MLRCLDSWNASEKNAKVEFSSSHQYTVTVPSKQHTQASNEVSIVPWVQEPGGHQHAIEMAKSLIDGMVRGALESFETTLGPDVVAELQADFHIGGSQINVKLNRAYQDLEMRCKAAESTIESLRFYSDNKIEHLQSQIESYRKMLAGPGTLDVEFERLPSDPPSELPGARRTLSPAAMERQRVKYGDLAGLPPGRDATDDYFVQLHRDHSHDFSTAALRRVIGRLGEDVLQLVPKFAPGWPRQFEELPADTQATLISHLQHDAASVYRALMSPKAPHDEALSAFRRMRDALLPNESADEGVEEGPDEGLGGVPDDSRSDVKHRSARARR